MKDYLNKSFSEEIVNMNPMPPLKNVFFKHYDRKVMLGEINFLKMNMDKDAFICLSTDQSHDMTREDIINLCISMKLNLQEAEELMISAGYEKIV